MDSFHFFHGVWFVVGGDAGLNLAVAVVPRCVSGREFHPGKMAVALRCVSGREFHFW